MSVPPGNDPSSKLLELLSGKWKSQAVSTAAALGIADRLRKGPCTLNELAAQLECDASRLSRLMRVLAGIDLVHEDELDVFSVTELGRTLFDDHLGPLAAFVGAPDQWDPWSRLRDSLESNDAVPFELCHKRELYSLLADDEKAASRYDKAIDAFTRQTAVALAEAFDFSNAKRVIDVGGGRGTLLSEVLSKWPEVRGVLFDRPDVIDRARRFVNESLITRIEMVGGDFQEGLPSRGDIYVLKHVIHNWDDDTAISLLARCANQMNEGGRVLVIEGILLPSNRPDLTRLMDLEMLVLTRGGKERRKPEFRRLFRDAGLRLETTQLLFGSSYLIVGTRTN